MKIIFGVLILFSTCMLVMTGCKATQVSPDKYENSKIFFGHGGGFTGKLREFCVLDNGEVYRVHPAERTTTLRNTIRKSEAKALFKNLESLQLDQYPYDTPGNMFCWLKYHGNQDTTYLIWSDRDEAVDKNVRNIYKQLVSMTKQQ